MTSKLAWGQATAVLLLATALGSADAAVEGTITLMRDPSIGLPFTTPDASLPAPWVSYALGLRTTAGELIAGVEATLHGQFHQRWNFDEDLGSFQQTSNNANISNGDSHLRAAAGALFAFGPTENNSGASSPLPDTPISDYGVGTTLQGAWGIPPAQTTTNLAYIVIPKGSQPTLNFAIRVADPGGNIIGELNEFSFVPTFATAQISGNGMVINDGDNTPRLEDRTDFGDVEIGSFTQRTFTISNTGSQPVSLGPATLTGPYSLLGPLPSTINPGGSANFSVQLDTTTPGFFPGSISFASNAYLNGPFNFSLAAQVIPEPASTVLLAMGILGFAGGVHRLERKVV